MRARKPRCWVIVVMLASVGPQACRSKIDVKTSKGDIQQAAEITPPQNATNPEMTPPRSVLVANGLGLSGGKKHFQSRSVITLEVSREVLDGAASWQLLNMDLAAPEDESQATLVLTGQLAGEMSLYNDVFAFALAPEALRLSIYPGSEPRSKIRYGKNVLRFRTDNGNWTDVEVYQDDFDIFAVATTSFAGNRQVAAHADGQQFQGWAETLSPVAATDETSCTPDVAECNDVVLTHGVFNLINP